MRLRWNSEGYYLILTIQYIFIFGLAMLVLAKSNQKQPFRNVVFQYCTNIDLQTTFFLNKNKKPTPLHNPMVSHMTNSFNSFISIFVFFRNAMLMLNTGFPSIQPVHAVRKSQRDAAWYSAHKLHTMMGKLKRCKCVHNRLFAVRVYCFCFRLILLISLFRASGCAHGRCY